MRSPRSAETPLIQRSHQTEDIFPYLGCVGDLSAKEQKVGRLRMFWEEDKYDMEASCLDQIIEDISVCQRAARGCSVARQFELLSELEDSLSEASSELQHNVLAALAKELEQVLQPCPTAASLEKYAENLRACSLSVYEGIPIWVIAQFQVFEGMREVGEAGPMGEGHGRVYTRSDVDNILQDDKLKQGLSDFILKQGVSATQVYATSLSAHEGVEVRNIPILAWFNSGFKRSVARGNFAGLSKPDFLTLIAEEASRKFRESPNGGMPWSSLGWIAGLMIASKVIDDADFVPGVFGSWNVDGKPRFLSRTFRSVFAQVLPRFISDLKDWKAYKDTRMKEVHLVRAKLYAVGFTILISSGQVAAKYVADLLQKEGYWPEMESLSA